MWQEKGTKKKIRSFNSLCRLKHRTNWHGPLLFEIAWAFWSQKCSLCVLTTIRYLGIRGTTQYIMQIWRMHQRIFMKELFKYVEVICQTQTFKLLVGCTRTIIYIIKTRWFNCLVTSVDISNVRNTIWVYWVCPKYMKL